jgi:ABC-2 type transport system permease protein
MIASYFALILVAAAFLAIGVGISAMFNNQVAAFFVTMVILVALWWLMGFPGSYLQAGGEFFNYMDLQTHFYSLSGGKIVLSDVIYFLSLTAVGLFTGTMAVETRRWR